MGAEAAGDGHEVGAQNIVDEEDRRKKWNEAGLRVKEGN